MKRSLPPLPDRMKLLPIDDRGYRVPWFVAFIHGKPDFRVVRTNGIAIAYGGKKCWICGGVRGSIGAFVIGPMCAVNRVSSEPPSHLECAIYAATACPFLTIPKKERIEAGLDELGARNPAGEMIRRNPGVALVWTSRDWQPFRAGNGVLFDVGTPIETRWYAEGRKATRDEVMASIDSGLPLLRASADQDGAEAHKELDRQLETALALVPAA